MRQRERRGQALIEIALVIFVLVAILTGTLDFGQYLYFHQSLVERARAAARYGAVNPVDRAGIVNVALYDDPRGGTAPILADLTTTMIAVCLPGEGACANAASGPGARVTVTISGYRMATFNLVIPRSFTNRPITVSLPSEAPSS